MAVTDTREDTQLLRQLRAEFDELPGMCLTFEQTARLLGIDKRTCAQALETLVTCDFLTKRGGNFLPAAGSCCCGD